MYLILIEILLFFLLIVFSITKNDNITILNRKYTETLRGISILFVILMHSSCDAGMRVFTPLGGIGVAIFLILSGYGLTLSYQKTGLNGFIRKKIKRIFIPYFIFIFFLYIVRGNTSDIFSIQFLLDILLLKPSFWFIGFLTFNYLLFFLCFKFKWLYKWKYIIFFIAGILLLLFDSRIRAEQIFSFPFGIFIAEHYQQVKESIKNIFYCAIALFLISSLFLLFKQFPDIRDILNKNALLFKLYELIYKFGYAVCFIVFLKYIPSKINIFLGNNFLLFCSTISLELYLVHFSLRHLIDPNRTSSIFIFLIRSFFLSFILHKFNNSIIKRIR